MARAGETHRRPLPIAISSISVLVVIVIYKVPVRSMVKELQALAPSYHLHMLAPHPVISVLLTRHEAGAIVGYFNL